MADVREKMIKLVEAAGDKALARHIPLTADWIADHLIAHGVTVQEWIPVTERLPEKDVRVLVWMQDNEEGYTQMDTDRFSCTMEQGYHWIRWGKNVTHWIPLPEPPKEVE